MPAPGENLRINSERLWDSLMEMAKIGPGVAGGNNRQTLTDDDARGRALFQSWCEAAGMSMGVDTMALPAARASMALIRMPLPLKSGMIMTPLSVIMSHAFSISPKT